ncbi:MAG: hypothetical protein KDA96_09745 [Planctomycetaceae bacterium]|nr:hypothetical protein [Planctomycetaceae bacterium]
MAKFKPFVFGTLLGSAVMFLALQYHVVRSHDGLQLVPRTPQHSLGLAYADVRQWTPAQWTDRPELARALVAHGSSDLISQSVADSLTDAVSSSEGLSLDQLKNVLDKTVNGEDDQPLSNIRALRTDGLAPAEGDEPAFIPYPQEVRNGTSEASGAGSSSTDFNGPGLGSGSSAGGSAIDRIARRDSLANPVTDNGSDPLSTRNSLPGVASGSTPSSTAPFRSSNSSTTPRPGDSPNRFSTGNTFGSSTDDSFRLDAPAPPTPTSTGGFSANSSFNNSAIGNSASTSPAPSNSSNSLSETQRQARLIEDLIFGDAAPAETSEVPSPSSFGTSTFGGSNIDQPFGASTPETSASGSAATSRTSPSPGSTGSSGTTTFGSGTETTSATPFEDVTTALEDRARAALSRAQSTLKEHAAQEFDSATSEAGSYLNSQLGNRFSNPTGSSTGTNSTSGSKPSIQNAFSGGYDPFLALP